MPSRPQQAAPEGVAVAALGVGSSGTCDDSLLSLISGAGTAQEAWVARDSRAASRSPHPRSGFDMDELFGMGQIAFLALSLSLPSVKCGWDTSQSSQSRPKTVVSCPRAPALGSCSVGGLPEEPKAGSQRRWPRPRRVQGGFIVCVRRCRFI